MSFSLLTLLNPNTVNPSSVSVPVLSNTKVVTVPATLTLYGAMQKILSFFSRLIAKTTPHERAAGMEGGTQMVSMSRLLSVIFMALVPVLIMKGTTQQKPRMARQAIMPTNLSPSV